MLQCPKDHVTKPQNQTKRHDSAETGICLHEEARHTPSVKSVEPQPIEFGAWIVSDQSGLRQQILNAHGFKPVFAIFHDLHSKQQFNRLADQLHADKPLLLWIRLAGPACGSGNRRDDRRATYLVRLALEQMASGRHLIIEGNQRSEGWTLRPIRELQQHDLHETLHVWCRYQNPSDDVCNSVTRIWSNVRLTDCRECMCRTDRRHFASKQLPDHKRVEAIVLAHIIRDLSQCSDTRDKQPESISEPRVVSLISSPNDQQTSSNAVLKKTRFESDLHKDKQYQQRHQTCATSAVSQQVLPRDETLASTNPESHSQDRLRNPTSATTSSNSSQSFPTEQANRQKERKKLGLPIKKRKQTVEQHKDDVGDDLSSIQVTLEEVDHYMNQHQQDLNMSDWEHAISSFVFESVGVANNEPSVYANNINELMVHIQSFHAEHPQHVHVCELFGGEGLTSQLCSKIFGLQSGMNFEIQCGIDLNTEHGVTLLEEYLAVCKPDVVVMAPPCRGFGPWIHLNEVINPHAAQGARAEGVPLAKLCARVAEFQLNNKRHFILEQPRNFHAV